MGIRSHAIILIEVLFVMNLELHSPAWILGFRKPVRWKLKVRRVERRTLYYCGAFVTAGKTKGANGRFEKIKRLQRTESHIFSPNRFLFVFVIAGMNDIHRTMPCWESLDPDSFGRPLTQPAPQTPLQIRHKVSTWPQNAPHPNLIELPGMCLHGVWRGGLSLSDTMFGWVSWVKEHPHKNEDPEVPTGTTGAVISVTDVICQWAVCLNLWRTGGKGSRLRGGSWPNAILGCSSPLLSLSCFLFCLFQSGVKCVIWED